MDNPNNQQNNVSADNDESVKLWGTVVAQPSNQDPFSDDAYRFNPSFKKAPEYTAIFKKDQIESENSRSLNTLTAPTSSKNNSTKPTSRPRLSSQ